MAPNEYLIKASAVFPGLAPSRSLLNAMPLRSFPARHRVRWSQHQLRYSELLEILDINKFGMLLTESGKAVVALMLDNGLRMRGVVFLQWAMAVEADTHEHEGAIGSSLLHLAIHLAVSMGRGRLVLYYKWSTASDAERLEKLGDAVKLACEDLKIPDIPGHRRHGDDYIYAWLLMRHLACARSCNTGSTYWGSTTPMYLADVVAHIRRSIHATAAEADQGYGALAKTIAADTNKPISSLVKATMVDVFHQCIYGAGLMNIACVTDKTASHEKSIGHGLNFNGGAPVLLSQESVLDVDGLGVPLYVTYDRIETVPRDEDTGATHMISGLTPLTVRDISATHKYFFSVIRWDPKRDTIRSYVQYPFEFYER